MKRTFSLGYFRRTTFRIPSSSCDRESPVNVCCSVRKVVSASLSSDLAKNCSLIPSLFTRLHRVDRMTLAQICNQLVVRWWFITARLQESCSHRFTEDPFRPAGQWPVSVAWKPSEVENSWWWVSTSTRYLYNLSFLSSSSMSTQEKQEKKKRP